MIVKVAQLWPESTVTKLGTVATELLLDRFTTNPLDPAFPFRLTVPVVEAPPLTVEGLILTRAKLTGEIVRVAN